MKRGNLAKVVRRLSGAVVRFNDGGITSSFRREFLRFEKLSQVGEQRFALRWQERLPCLDDDTPTTGFDRHYIYHPAWAARILAQTKPPLHVDVSSTLYFCTLVSAFVPVKFLDFRPAILQLSDLTSEAGDLMQLPFADNSVASLSCMHVIEHLGLGRYGDALNPEGDLKAIAELMRVTAPGGTLLFVTPIGAPRIQFNAHRIYSYRQVIDYFGDMSLREFALVPDDARDGGLIYNASEAQADRQRYGCGCFWFVKPSKAE